MYGFATWTDYKFDYDLKCGFYKNGRWLYSSIKLNIQNIPNENTKKKKKTSYRTCNRIICFINISPKFIHELKRESSKK